MTETSGLLLDLPKNQEPIATAIYAHGFGDTHDGPIGRALARECTANGIALARVSLVNTIGNDLMTMPYSEQMDRLCGAIEAFNIEAQDLPCHIVSHSQGAFAASAVALDGPDRIGGSLVLTAPPLANPFDRLKEQLVLSTDKQSDPNIVGHILQPLSKRIILITRSFWDEAAEIAPFGLIKENYAAGDTLIMLAGKDEVLGIQAQQVAELQRLDDCSIETLNDADHSFGTNGSRARLAEWVAHNLRTATTQIIEAA